MKIITINLPEKYLEAIQTLNDLGVYPSRSEAIRTALSQFLSDELKMFENLDEETFKMLVRSNQKNRS
jgi:Arc/MetJ-type ribon-helix-helix transcriptional regulator